MTTGRPPSRARIRVLAAVALAVLAPTVLAACAGQEQQGTDVQRVTTWFNGAGAGSDIGAVGDALTSVDTGTAEHLPAAQLKTLCAVLGDAARQGNDNLPTPDQTLTTALSNAYDTAFDAGEECYKSAADGDAGAAKLSAGERARAAVMLSAAIARYVQVTGKVPSTTTTTDPDASFGDPFGGT